VREEVADGDAAGAVLAIFLLPIVIDAFAGKEWEPYVFSPGQHRYRDGVWSGPVLVLTDQERTYRQMALVWGVIPCLVPHCDTYWDMVKLALEAVRSRGLARDGDRVVVTAGVPFDVPGSTRAFDLDGRQVRYLTIRPRKPEVIRSIQLVKARHESAPIVVAVTVELPPPPAQPREDSATEPTASPR